MNSLPSLIMVAKIAITQVATPEFFAKNRASSRI
jgi:hypothetical protein